MEFYYHDVDRDVLILKADRIDETNAEEVAAELFEISASVEETLVAPGDNA